MSQHGFSIADESGAAYLADVNNALQALASQSSGTTEPSTKYAYQVWADTTASLVKRRNAANSAWLVIASLSETYVVSRASNTILAGSDYGKTFVATASFTQTLTAAATLGDGWQVDYRIEAGVTIVFDPNASENIDGATTKSVTGPAGGRIYCDGSGFKTVGLDAAPSTLPITNSLSADVLLNNTANYFDGPSVAQGTSGKWFVSGTISVSGNSGSVIHAKLWDGTTVIDSGFTTIPPGGGNSITLSGFLTAPAGNLRISAKDSSDTAGIIKFNFTGNSKDSTITAIRIG